MNECKICRKQISFIDGNFCSPCYWPLSSWLNTTYYDRSIMKSFYTCSILFQCDVRVLIEQKQYEFNLQDVKQFPKQVFIHSKEYINVDALIEAVLDDMEHQKKIIKSPPKQNYWIVPYHQDKANFQDQLLYRYRDFLIGFYFNHEKHYCSIEEYINIMNRYVNRVLNIVLERIRTDEQDLLQVEIHDKIFFQNSFKEEFQQISVKRIGLKQSVEDVYLLSDFILNDLKELKLRNDCNDLAKHIESVFGYQKMPLTIHRSQGLSLPRDIADDESYFRQSSFETVIQNFNIYGDTFMVTG